TSLHVSFTSRPPPPPSTLFPYTTLFRSHRRSDRRRAWRDARGRKRPTRIGRARAGARRNANGGTAAARRISTPGHPTLARGGRRSEEHTSELQSRFDLVCRLLLEKKKAA